MNYRNSIRCSELKEYPTIKEQRLAREVGKGLVCALQAVGLSGLSETESLIG